MVSFFLIAAETKIRDILNNITTVFVDEVEDAVTASNLCRCQNPVTTAFEASQGVIALISPLGTVLLKWDCN